MTITKHFIDRAAFKKGISLPDDLREWLAVEYAVEPYDGFWLESDLEELISLHYGAYCKGMLDTSIPEPAELWRIRYNSLHDFVEELKTDYDILYERLARAEDLLADHGISF